MRGGLGGPAWWQVPPGGRHGPARSGTPSDRDRRAPRRVIADPPHHPSWTSTSDPLENVNRSHAMVFQTKEDAIAFCDKHGIEWSVREPNLPDKVRRGRYKQYGDNYGLMGGHRFKGGPPTYDKCLTYGDKSGFDHVKGFDHLEYKAPAKKGGKKKA